MFQDLRYGVRMLLRKPGLVMAAVLCLALGVGANLTIFSLFNAVLLKPISGVKEADRLVVMFRTGEGGGFELTSYPDYRDYRDRTRVFSDLLAYRAVSLNLSSGEYPERLYGALASGNYFSLLGVEAALGRTFRPEEDRTRGTHPVAVISHRLWQRQFGANPAVIGQIIRLNTHPFTIIGVAPADFRGTETGEILDVWTPLMMHARARPQADGTAGELLEMRDKNWLALIGRIKPGVSLAQAEADLKIIAAQLKQDFPKESGKTTGVRLSSHVGLGPVDYSLAGRFLGLLLAIVWMVLLIACANVANLLLVRAAARRKEVAIRMALGANRLRIVRQFLTESFLIAALGTAVGLLIPYIAKDWLLSLFTRTLDAASIDFSPDYTVIIFTVMLSLTTVFLFGLAPAIQASKPDLVPELKESISAGGAGRWRLSSLFVVAQIAISLVLLVGAGLMIRTMQKVYSVNLGFEIGKMLTLSFDLQAQKYNEEQGRQFYRQLLERSSSLPGVNSAGLAAILPLGWGTNSHEVAIEGHPPRPDGRPLIVDHNVVTPGYFSRRSNPAGHQTRTQAGDARMRDRIAGRVRLDAADD